MFNYEYCELCLSLPLLRCFAERVDLTRLPLDSITAPQATSLPLPDTGGRYLSFCAHQVLTAASGCVLPWSSSVLEPGTVEAAEKLIPGKTVFAVGAQGPRSFWDGEGKLRETMSEGDLEVMQFLDGVEKKRGGKRALYISFSSLSFPFFALVLFKPDLRCSFCSFSSSQYLVPCPPTRSHRSPRRNSPRPPRRSSHPFRLRSRFAPRQPHRGDQGEDQSFWKRSPVELCASVRGPYSSCDGLVLGESTCRLSRLSFPLSFSWNVTPTSLFFYLRLTLGVTVPPKRSSAESL